MDGILPPQIAQVGDHLISPAKTLKTFFPTHPVEEKIGSEQDF
jgi:hypothetical protein